MSNKFTKLTILGAFLVMSMSRGSLNAQEIENSSQAQVIQSYNVHSAYQGHAYHDTYESAQKRCLQRVHKVFRSARHHLSKENSNASPLLTQYFVGQLPYSTDWKYPLFYCSYEVLDPIAEPDTYNPGVKIPKSPTTVRTDAQYEHRYQLTYHLTHEAANNNLNITKQLLRALYRENLKIIEQKVYEDNFKIQITQTPRMEKGFNYSITYEVIEESTEEQK